MTAAADDTVLEAVLRRDRQAVVAALIAVIAMAWLWILFGGGTGMSAMDMFLGPSAFGMAGMMVPAVWTLGYAGVMFVMWWVMMAAMMLPSAAPILLLFARINRKEKSTRRPFIPTGIFAAGYLVAWGGFSALATGLPKYPCIWVKNPSAQMHSDDSPGSGSGSVMALRYCALYD